MPDQTSPATGDRRWAFERDVDGYMAGRPPYPPRVFSLLTDLGVLRADARLLEIGPGTGQATAELLARGPEVDAIELGPQMAERLRTHLPTSRLRITVGDVHQMPLLVAAYDAVVAATVFHWLDVPSLLPRLAAALKPGGWLVVWWNVFGDPDADTPFRRQVDRIFREMLPSEYHPAAEIPRAMQTVDRMAELAAGGYFVEPVHEVIRWNAHLDRERVQALFATFPAVSGQDPDLRSAVLAALAAAVDAEGGAVEDPMVTAIYAARVATSQ